MAHVVWICTRFNSRSRVRLDGHRYSDHGLDLLSETRQSIDQCLLGFPFHSEGWQSLSSVLADAGQSVQALQLDPEWQGGTLVALALLGPGFPYTGPLQDLDTEAIFLVNYACMRPGSFFKLLDLIKIEEP